MTNESSVTVSAGPAAFGDGAHPTTQGVLAALEAIDPAAFTPEKACDVGCGSGILALAIAKKFPCAIIAIDIEAQSVLVTKENAEKNGLAAHITALQADGFMHPTIWQTGPFDLIVMNILAQPLLRLADAAERYLTKGGVMIISGLLSWQEAPIKAAYEGMGLELTSRIVISDWVTMVWQKA
jgi:ribosomal protein L11 methyltransferase